MLKEERQQIIINEMYKNGKVLVNELASIFSISKDTIRRDLNEMEEKGILKRVFGGAIPYKMPVANYDTREKKDRNNKYIIAKKALQFVENDQLIVIDGGSTNKMFASLLPRNLSLKAVTNSFSIANELRNHPKIDVIFLGGKYLKESQTTVGEITSKQLKGYHFDLCFLGVYAIDLNNGVSVPFEEELGIKQEFVEHSEKVIAMCTTEKLNKTSKFIVCKLSDVDVIVCDNDISIEEKKKYNSII